METEGLSLVYSHPFTPIWCVQHEKHGHVGIYKEVPAIFKMVNQQGRTIYHRTLLIVMWQPGLKGSLGENGYIYLHGWVPLLSTWSYHNIVNQLHSDIKQKVFFFFLSVRKDTSKIILDDRDSLAYCCCFSVTKLCLTLCDPMDCNCQASLSFTISWSWLKLMSVESMLLSNHLILCCPFLLLPSTFPSIRVFSNELALHIRQPK